jgi:hypothetical protein
MAAALTCCAPGSTRPARASGAAPTHTATGSSWAREPGSRARSPSAAHAAAAGAATQATALLLLLVAEGVSEGAGAVRRAAMVVRVAASSASGLGALAEVGWDAAVFYACIISGWHVS